jgi:hypothetical protein
MLWKGTLPPPPKIFKKAICGQIREKRSVQLSQYAARFRIIKVPMQEFFMIELQSSLKIVM